MTVERLAQLITEASEAHHTYEQQRGRADATWACWYAAHILNRATLDEVKPFHLDDIMGGGGRLILVERRIGRERRGDVSHMGDIDIRIMHAQGYANEHRRGERREGSDLV